MVELAATGALHFPILCSIRVIMRKSIRADDTGGEYVNTVIVEAASQDLLCARSMPNASLNYLADLLHMVSPDATRMIAAPMSSVRRVSHVGIVVNSAPASCVLSLLAHVGRSETIRLEGGHRKNPKVLQSTPM